MSPSSSYRHERAASVGREVRRAREALRVDQETAALLAGVSVRFLRELEHGKPTVQLDKLVDVLDALGLELRIERRRA